MRSIGIGTPCDLLGSVEVPGLRAEVRLFPWTPPYRPREAPWEINSSGGPTLALLAFLEKDDPLLSSACEVEAFSIQDLSMLELMRLLHDEIRAPGFGSAAMAESAGEILRIKLSRLTRRQDAAAAGRLGQREMGLIRDCLESQSGRPPSVAELARICNMSPRNLLRRFRAASGTTVAAYVAEVQLAKAKRLLATTNLSIKQIAYETGFTAPSNFSAAFKRHLGVAPRAFRTAVRGA